MDRFVSLVAASLSLSCGGDFSAPPGQAEGSERLDVGGEVEIFSWWTSGGEEEALNALFDVHRNRVPEVELTNAAVEFAEKAQKQLANRLAVGLPPDMFQANGGADLRRWIVMNGKNADDSVVEPLDDLAAALNWEKHLDPALLNSVTYDESIYALPINIHRLNSLFFRSDLFEKFDLKPPTTLEELHTLCDEVRAREDIQESHPGGVSCMSIGAKWQWTLTTLGFDILLPTVGGADFYHDYLTGVSTADHPKLVAALDELLYLYCGGTDTSNCLRTSYFNSNMHDLTWDEGVGMLTDGSALMTPMGDWAKGFLESKAGGELIPGKDFDIVPFPGSADTFVFATDVLTLPKGAINRDGARSLLKTSDSKAGQIAFNRLKGSIPARNDINPEEFDEVSQATIRAFRDADKVDAVSGYLSGDAREELNHEIPKSLKTGSVDGLLRYLQASYPLK